MMCLNKPDSKNSRKTHARTPLIRDPIGKHKSLILNEKKQGLFYKFWTKNEAFLCIF